MSDAKDSIAKAVVLQKKRAAGLLVKKEELEERAARGEQVTAELDAVTQELAAVMKEIAELRRMADKGGGPSVAAIMGDDDPLTPSLETSALDRARQRINELDAEAGLGAKSDDTLSDPPAQKPPVKRTM